MPCRRPISYYVRNKPAKSNADSGRRGVPLHAGHEIIVAQMVAGIDHRRVPNLARYLSRHAWVLACEVSPGTLPAWQPGDIVVWKTAFGRDHIGLISDGLGPRGVPFAIY